MNDDRNSPPESMARYLAAADQFQDGSKQARIVSFRKGQDSEYDTWRVAAEVGHRTTFKELGEFFVNLPSLRDRLADESVTAGWAWTEIEPTPLRTLFAYRPELLGLLRTKAGADGMLTAGWRLKTESGRIDAETTWSENTYLFSTKSYHALVKLYTWTIH